MQHGMDYPIDFTIIHLPFYLFQYKTGRIIVMSTT